MEIRFTIELESSKNINNKFYKTYGLDSKTAKLSLCKTNSARVTMHLAKQDRHTTKKKINALQGLH